MAVIGTVRARIRYVLLAVN